MKQRVSAPPPAPGFRPSPGTRVYSGEVHLLHAVKDIWVQAGWHSACLKQTWSLLCQRAGWYQAAIPTHSARSRKTHGFITRKARHQNWSRKGGFYGQVVDFPGKSYPRLGPRLLLDLNHKVAPPSLIPTPLPPKE